MSYQIELLELQPQPTLSMRTHTPVSDLPQFLGKAYGSVMQYLSELGELPHGAPFAAYYNMDMENLDIEAGFPVGKPLPAKENILSGEIPGGEYAAGTFTGPYEELSAIYDALNEWMQTNGHEPTGIVYELYLNDPSTVAPQELQTQILFPLK